MLVQMYTKRTIMSEKAIRWTAKQMIQMINICTGLFTGLYDIIKCELSTKCQCFILYIYISRLLDQHDSELNFPPATQIKENSAISSTIPICSVDYSLSSLQSHASIGFILRWQRAHKATLWDDHFWNIWWETQKERALLKFVLICSYR